MKRLFKDNNVYAVDVYLLGENIDNPLEYVGLDEAYEGIERVRKEFERETGLRFKKMIEDDPSRADYIVELLVDETVLVKFVITIKEKRKWKIIGEP